MVSIIFKQGNNLNKGFSLIETVLTLTILIFVFSAITGIIIISLRAHPVQEDYAVNNQQSQIIMDEIVSELMGTRDVSSLIAEINDKDYGNGFSAETFFINDNLVQIDLTLPDNRVLTTVIAPRYLINVTSE